MPKITNDPKSKLLTIRETPDNLETLRRGAKLAGLTMSEFTRLTALNAAKALVSGATVSIGDNPR